MSTESEISRLETAKSSLAEAITAKGVAVPTDTKLDGYAALVEQIQAGGVESLNGLVGALNLVAGVNTSITPSGANITIDSTVIKPFTGGKLFDLPTGIYAISDPQPIDKPTYSNVTLNGAFAIVNADHGPKTIALIAMATDYSSPYLVLGYTVNEIPNWYGGLHNTSVNGVYGKVTIKGTGSASVSTSGNTITIDVPEQTGGISQEEADNRYLQLTGGTLTGNLQLPITSGAGLYFGANAYLGYKTFTNPEAPYRRSFIFSDSNPVGLQNIAEPYEDTDAVNKKYLEEYVDQMIGAIENGSY